jgi:hypothetical protein
MGPKNAIVIGDSHMRLFKWIQDRKLCPEFSFNVLSVPGATAYGSTSLLSRSQFLSQTQEFLSVRQRQEQMIFIGLGEVDCNIAAAVHARERQVTVGIQIEDSVARLVDYAVRIVAPMMPDIPIVFLCPTLPCVQDRHLKNGLKARRTGCESLEQRTINTKRFCNQLIVAAADRGLSCVSINDKIEDPATGFLADGYYRSCGDHHLTYRKVYGYWLAKIEKYNNWNSADQCG